MYQETGAAEWRHARRAMDRWARKPNKNATTTHDLGFMIFDSFGRGFLLTGDAHYRDVVMQASRSLIDALQPEGGSDQVVGHRSATRRAKGWKYPVIVDNMMNLKMLFWAGSHGGDSAWARAAERHALTSARAHVRDDGSTAHIALFDPRRARSSAR